jgi:hypothetical protein
MRVRYEDLCREPRATVDSILTHCGLDPAGLRWHADDEVEVSPQHSISGNPSRFDVGRVRIRADEEWQADLQRARQFMVATLCGPLLKAFGYPLRPSRAQQPARADGTPGSP